MTPSQRADETPLFSRYADLMAWLAQRVEGFPRSQRFVLASRLMDTGFRGYEALIRARKVSQERRAEALLQADVELELLRLQLRLAHELRCVSTKQYEYGAGLINQVGKMVGSWRN